MTDSDPLNNETLSYSMIERIDRICDQFELELRRDSKPRIEDYLTRVEAIARNQLLRDLIAIEFEFGRRTSTVDFADYFQRFPESGDDLRFLQLELELSQSKSQKTPHNEMTGDITIAAPTPPKLRNFKLLRVVGTGGFGVVWKATDLRLQREVAVKIPRTDGVGGIDMSAVVREARMAAKLRHPNIVSVHEVGEENGTSFVVTDYIDGVNLKEWRKKHSLNPSEAARLVAKLAIAVQHAHENGVIHRDLKLANVLIDAQGEPHIADFGLAKREARDDSLAIDGQVIGTPAYMAPEQARADHGSIDRRTDVYSLGVILYELLTDTIPFRGDLPHLLQQIMQVAPVAPRTIKPNIPKDLQAICLKCLAKDNSKRYDTAKALADDLFLFLNGETLRGIPAALPNRVLKWFRRNRRTITITAAVALLVAAGSSGVMIWLGVAKPAVPLLPVEFTTNPPGCEITVVTIDSDTGEPNPAKIQTARNKTPVTMSLAGGDYLVVAVLDSLRFTEVYRHVPEPGERIPFTYNHLKWKKLPSGVIEVPVIPIPRPDVSASMGFCEGTDHLVEPTSKIDGKSKVWRIPPFYVDRREVTIADLKEWNVRPYIITEAGDGPIARQHFYNSLKVMEENGKRFPSAAELYYLSNAVCPDPKPSESDETPCALPDKSLIEGLHFGVWEWTSTKPGGPFSGIVPQPKSLGVEGMSRMIGCGKGEPDASTKQIGFVVGPTGFHVSKEFHVDAGARGVRSVRPRRTPLDFANIVDRKNDR